MEIRQFAEHVLLAETLADKLHPPPAALSDVAPGEPTRVAAPGRPPNLQFAARRTAPAMPRGEALRDPQRRAIAHHIMANHELQALEVMAWTLCAFPDAPAEFRAGLADIMRDEQRHTRMHVDRARVLGVEFGQFPVNAYIWRQTLGFRDVLDYLACLPLLFEGRNLDHTLEFAAEFDAAGDARSAALMRVIHRDEVGHVAFGLAWLQRLKPPAQSDWDAFESHLHWPLRPVKARGAVFQRAARAEAGFSPEFIARLDAAEERGGSAGHAPA